MKQAFVVFSLREDQAMTGRNRAAGR